MKTGKTAGAVFAILFATALYAPALDIPIAVMESQGLERRAEPVSVGVPLPRGRLASTERLAVKDPAGNKIPAQFRVLGWWHPTPRYPQAKSIRWVLADFQAQAPADGTATYRLTDEGGNPAHPAPVSVKADGRTLRVETGVLAFSIDRDNFRLFDAVTLNGSPVAQARENDGHIVEGMDGQRYHAARDGREPPVLTTADYRMPFDGYLRGSAHNPPQKLRVEVEEQGPLRTVIRVDGVMQAMSEGGEHTFRNFSAAGDPTELVTVPNRDELIGYRIRIHAYAGQPFVRVFHTVINLRGQSHTATDQGRYRSAAYIADAIQQPGRFLVRAIELNTTLAAGDGPLRALAGGATVHAATLAPAARRVLYQDSSAGWVWQAGEDRIYDPVLKRNMDVLGVKPGLEKPYHEYSDIHYKILAGQDGGSFMGYRWLDEQDVAAAEGNRAAGWADLSDGSKGLTVAVRWFWQMYPTGIELRGDGSVAVGILPRQWKRGHFMDGKIHRTHELFYRFHAGDTPARVEQAAQAFLQPLVAHAGLATYRDSGAVNFIAAPDPENWPGYEGMIETAVRLNNPKVNPAFDSSYEIEREKEDCFGWWHFGDTAKRGFRGFSQFQEFDSSRCLFMHFWRTGDPKFFLHGEELARFLMGIPSFGGGYGHQHPERSHNWIQGLMDYYHMTGSLEAHDAIEAMKGYYEQKKDPKDFAWNFNGRNAAYAINGLRQMFEWTGDPAWLEAAGHCIRVVRHSPRMRPVSGFFGGNPGGFMQHTLGDALGRYAALTGDEDAIDWLLGLAGYFKPLSNQGGGLATSDLYAYATLLTGDRRYLDAAIHTMKDSRHSQPGSPRYRTGDSSSKTWSGDVGGYGQIFFHALNEWKPQDTVAPAPVTDLAAAPGPQPGSVTLTWTNTGDNGHEGRAAALQVKHAEGEIVEYVPWGRKGTDAVVEPEWKDKVNFWAARNAQGEPAPLVAGEKQSWTLQGLPPGKTLHFAMTVHDDAGNRSRPSNSAQALVP